MVHTEAGKDILVQDGGSGTRKQQRSSALFFPSRLLTPRVSPFSFPPAAARDPQQSSIPRGVVDISRCLSIKGAEDVINRAHAFELSTNSETMFLIADSDKEKEEWISSVGRAIVRQSKSMTDDYGSY